MKHHEPSVLIINNDSFGILCFDLRPFQGCPFLPRSHQSRALAKESLGDSRGSPAVEVRQQDFTNVGCFTNRFDHHEPSSWLTLPVATAPARSLHQEICQQAWNPSRGADWERTVRLGRLADVKVLTS